MTPSPTTRMLIGAVRVSCAVMTVRLCCPPVSGRLHGGFRDGRSGLAQQDPAHAVLGVLGQDQGGPSQEGRQIRAGEEWVLV